MRSRPERRTLRHAAAQKADFSGFLRLTRPSDPLMLFELRDEGFTSLVTNSSAVWPISRWVSSVNSAGVKTSSARGRFQEKATAGRGVPGVAVVAISHQ